MCRLKRTVYTTICGQHLRHTGLWHWPDSIKMFANRSNLHLHTTTQWRFTRLHSYDMPVPAALRPFTERVQLECGSIVCFYSNLFARCMCRASAWSEWLWCAFFFNVSLRLPIAHLNIVPANVDHSSAVQCNGAKVVQANIVVLWFGTLFD